MNKEDIESIVPLLPAQQFMLSASLKSSNSEYVQQLLFQVKTLDYSQIFAGISTLIASYECLRSQVLYEGLKQPVWVTLRNGKPKIAARECSWEAVLLEKDRIRKQGFNLAQEPALRFDWFVTPQGSYLLLTNHHLLYDGWGRQQLLGDFIQLLYSPKLHIPKRSIKAWYEAWKTMDHGSALEAYRKYLIPLSSFAEFTEVVGGQLGTRELVTEIPINELKVHSSKMGLTQAEYINFTWCCFMARWTSNPDVQVGVVKQNGLIEKVKNGFGLAIQTLPLQFHADLNETPAALLPLFKERERSVVAFPFVDSTHPVFNNLSYKVLIAFENYPLNEQLESVASSFELIESYDYSEFPLSIAITPSEEKLTFQWHLNMANHSELQILEISKGYMSYLALFPELIHAPIKFEQSWSPKPNQNTSVKDFMIEVEERIQADERWELYQSLVDTFKARQTSRIWCYGDKHRNMDLVLIAAWKNDVSVVMVNEKESDSFVNHLRLSLPPEAIFTAFPDHRTPHAVLLDLVDLSHVRGFGERKNPAASLCICTSGSTGTPKVVQLTLNNLVAFFNAWNHKLPWRDQEHFAVIAHPAFDIGVAELIFPLWKGWKRTFITKDMFADELNLPQLFQSVTAFHMVPALLEQWIHAAPNDDKVRIVMTGGDRVPPRIYNTLKLKFSKTRLFQFYGPSECSVLATGFENVGQYGTELLPLGTPFEHACVSVCNEEFSTCPPFQEGEIMIGGSAVGSGYFENETGSFLELRGERIYRTGDRGFQDAQGNLFFMGRKDQQIKINGQRIELSRIENALMEWSGIDQWQIIYQEPVLTAFYTSEIQELPSRNRLLDVLPAYAIPSNIEKLPHFPVNKNGKIDRLALVERSKALMVKDQTSLPPEYLGILEELFPNRNIDVGLNWFANGLNSIDAMKMSGKVKKNLAQTLSVRSILTCVNVSQLPNLLEDELPSSYRRIQPNTKVHEAASRLFFLSESDEQLAKTYWIRSAFRINFNADLEPFLQQWAQEQTDLSLCIKSIKSSYYWQRSNIALHRLESSSVAEFMDLIDSTERSMFKHLLHVFYSFIEGEILLGITVHHGLLDGLGMQQILESFLKDLQNHQVTFLQLLEPETEDTDVSFWRPYLEKVVIKKLPFERKQPLTDKNRLRIALSRKEHAQIMAWKNTYGCSTFEAGLIGWVQHWYRYFPEHDFSTGIVASSRGTWNEHEIVAMSANTLPMVVNTDEAESILQQWKRLREKAKQPFAEIAKLETQKQQEGTPFFNTCFVYNQWESNQHITPLEFETHGVAFDLSLDFIDEGGTWYFQWEFDASKFSPEAIEKIHAAYFQQENTEEMVVQYEVPTLNERWNRTVQNFPHRTAIQQKEQSISYADLHLKIHQLRSMNQGNSFGIVPLLLERTIDHVAFLMMMLLEEIAFIPIDEDTPKERIQHIEALCGNPCHSANDLVITSGAITSVTPHLCYAIATSGTTGKPKLVGVKKKGYAAAVSAWEQQYTIRPEDRILQAASFSFDVFLGDIGRSLFQGATLVLTDKFERKDPIFLLGALKEYEITLFETTPLVVRWWLQEPPSHLPQLRLLIVGSDTWKMHEMESLISAVPETTKVISSYGLSETTIDNSFFSWRNGYHPQSVVPIGKAMNHSRLSICTERGAPLPDGLEGLLKIDGPCVGLGYFQGEQWSNLYGSWLTADRGIRDEFGEFHFLGRTDQQVKIRGQRLELHEVEQIISTYHPHKTWVAFTFDSGFSSELGIACTGSLSSGDKNRIIQHLTRSFPSYYVPTAWLEVESFSMNQNGKIDVAPLMELAKHSQNNLEITLSGDALERLSALIKQLFNREIEASDHFFGLGLSSFDAMYFVREWNHLFQERLQVHQLFSALDFKGLAQSISLSPLDENIEDESMEVFPANAAQQAIWFEIQSKDSSIYNLPHFIELPNDVGLKTLIQSTLKACNPLFVRFEMTETGELFQRPIDSHSFEIDCLSLSREEMEDFKKNAYYHAIDLKTGPCFEANFLECEGKTHFYFNPHHIAYDGGSDAALAELFDKIRNGQDAKAKIVGANISARTASWKTYFNLAPLPKALHGTATHSITPNIVSLLSADTVSNIQYLQQQWKTSPSVIYGVLLGSALERNDACINWISLVVDTREEPCIGMHMRAFPIPYLGTSTLEEEVSQVHSALEFIYQHKHSTILYPTNTEPFDYHQVGLVIQHPQELLEQAVPEPVQMTRARLPLTLYVETFGGQVQLRWEYDRGYFTQDRVLKMHQQLEQLCQEWLRMNVVRKPLQLSEDTLPIAGDYRPEGPLKTLWEKYLGTQASNDFFLSGGTSLKALIMLKEIQATLKKSPSLVNFFKDARFETLEAQMVTKQAIFWEMQTGSNGNEWFFPPIFGLGLIFNSYPLQPEYRSVAFNYPGALGIEEGMDSIEHLASYLLKAFEEQQALPRKIERIVAYSMGGLVAFEMIKLLEKRGVQVAQFVIWDKPAQLRYEPDFKRDLHETLYEYAHQIALDDQQKESIIHCLKQHQRMIETCVQQGIIQSDIVLYYCQNGFEDEANAAWAQLTRGTFQAFALSIEITHYDIPKHWNKV
jgi:non-ribosomal peptide synthetase component F/aryl carrier-like protein